MKGLDIINIPSCTSNNSIEIISSNIEFPSSSSSSSASASTSSTTTSGGRAIDRHNPIITDEKRSGFSNSCTTTPLRTPLTNNVLQKKPPSPTPQIISPKTLQSPLKKKGNKLPTFTKKSTKKNTTTKTNPPFLYDINKNIRNDNNNNNSNNNNDDDNNKSGRRSFSRASDLMMKASKCSNTRPGKDYISPPESSRYLLDDDTSFLEVLSDFDPVLKLVSREVNISSENNKVEVLKSESTKPPLPSSTSGQSDQVVVLRVSLHCRGCERKMKKHLSRMPGVRSFNIDFAAKKVTVVGDVTPLQVLSSISKVKFAQLWTPAMQSSSQLNYPKNIQLRK